MVWCRDEAILYDIFEPTFIKGALKADTQTKIPLHNLIFGSEWSDLELGTAPLLKNLDPLTQVFTDLGKLSTLAKICCS